MGIYLQIYYMIKKVHKMFVDFMFQEYLVYIELPCIINHSLLFSETANYSDGSQQASLISVLGFLPWSYSYRSPETEFDLWTSCLTCDATPWASNIVAPQHTRVLRERWLPLLMLHKTEVFKRGLLSERRTGKGLDFLCSRNKPFRFENFCFLRCEHA
jgi:hypothetical protein